MMQQTVVAFYGPKPEALVQLIAMVQDTVKGSIGAAFQAYDIAQVHATIIGLEHKPGSPLLNRNFARHRGIDVEMEIRDYLEFLLSRGHLPFRVQVGGFRDREYPFRSRGEHPYHRSFSIQGGDHGDRVVIMGWPAGGVAGRSEMVGEKVVYPVLLDDLRRAAQGFGILHHYHRTPADTDNDFYFRVGVIERSALGIAEKQQLESTVRKRLESEPLLFEVDADRLAIASYRDSMLPLETTTVCPVARWLRRVEEAAGSGTL